MNAETPEAASTPVAQAWKALAGWPAPAVADIWAVLGPLSKNPRNPEAPQRLKSFCQQHKLARGEVGETVSVLHNLLLNAAAGDASKEDFQRHLATLGCGGAGDRMTAILLAGYDQAKLLLRRRLLRVALAAHGKVLTTISWRMDTIGDSDAARHLATSVLVLTLNWQEGSTQGRTTVQLTPDAIRELRRVLDQFAV
ncbi:MAG TPA: hypothetical protein VNF99_00220 [Stellaceae bacterium]|nr:hypothetical protein [Stellaceae bacterium]